MPPPSPSEGFSALGDAVRTVRALLRVAFLLVQVAVLYLPLVPFLSTSPGLVTP